MAFGSASSIVLKKLSKSALMAFITQSPGYNSMFMPMQQYLMEVMQSVREDEPASLLDGDSTDRDEHEESL